MIKIASRPPLAGARHVGSHQAPLRSRGREVSPQGGHNERAKDAMPQSFKRGEPS